MKKTTALTLFTVFDLFALAILYVAAVQPYGEICTALAHRAEYIRVTANFYIGFGVVVIPAIHVIGFFEIHLPHLFNMKLCAAVIFAALTISLSFGAGMTKMVRQELLRNGYVHCENAWAQKDTLIFTRDEASCRRLAREQTLRRLLGMIWEEN